MVFITNRGFKKNITLKKYLVDWGAEEASLFQTSVKKFLRKYWENNLVCSEFPVVGTRFTIDLFNVSKRIAIEAQGIQHTSFSPFFHGKNKMNYVNQIKRDTEKERWCIINNIRFIEIFPKDLEVLSEDWFREKYNINL